MPPPVLTPLAERVRRLAEFLAASDALRVRIERDDDEIELARSAPMPAAAAAQRGVEASSGAEAKAPELEAIKADLVGIFRLARPAPAEGELVDDDRELAYVEALGIRNPVRMFGGGRLVAISVTDGAPVEYGQPLFLVDRG